MEYYKRISSSSTHHHYYYPVFCSIHRLLSLPSGIENRLLLFVASGVGGVRTLLNLRLVCKTTKSWIDNTTVPVGERIFSKAHLHFESNRNHLCPSIDFWECQPPFAKYCTSLSLDIKILYNFKSAKSSPDGKITLRKYEKFCQVWIEQIKCFAITRPTGCTVIPEDSVREHLYSRLLNKATTKLESISVPVSDEFDMLLLSQFIELNKNNACLRIYLTFTMESLLYEEDSEWIEIRNKFFYFLIHSGLNVSVTIEKELIFETLKEILSPLDYNMFCSRVVSITMLVPTNDTLDLSSSFPQLESVDIDCNVSEDVHLENLILPSTLNNAGFYFTPLVLTSSMTRG